jgi:putative ABC transport system permease protein
MYDAESYEVPVDNRSDWPMGRSTRVAGETRIQGGNFVSMMTARATRRAVEVGVRKAVGALRRQIALQFMGECLFYAVLALLCAVVAVEIMLPAFNGFLQRQIAFDYLRDPALATALIGLALLSGCAAGAYPAFYLSGFKPAIVLRGFAAQPRASRIRQLMVVLQFATLIALLVATLTVQRQTRYALEERLRVPTDQIYLNNAESGCSRESLDAIRNLKPVLVVTCASRYVSTHYLMATFVSPRGDGTLATRAVPVDDAFFDVFGITPLAGRLLSRSRGQDMVLQNGSDVQDNPAIVINESAARALGFNVPAEAVGKFPQWRRVGIDDGRIKVFEMRSSQIVGVVPDFSIGSVRDAIEPTVYYVDPVLLSRLVVRFDGGAVQEGMNAVEAVWNQREPGSRFEGTFLSQYMNALYADIVTQSTICSLFSAVAVALAALGLLGLAIFTAERRTKEIGLRKVMGARRTDILWFLGWQFARPVLWANVIAWPCAYLIMRWWLQGFEYHIELGLATFVIAGAAALVIALATISGHVLLVARARPVQALRYE